MSTNDFICTMCIKMFYSYRLKCDDFPSLNQHSFQKQAFQRFYLKAPSARFLSAFYCLWIGVRLLFGSHLTGDGGRMLRACASLAGDAQQTRNNLVKSPKDVDQIPGISFKTRVRSEVQPEKIHLMSDTTVDHGEIFPEYVSRVYYYFRV